MKKIIYISIFWIIPIVSILRFIVSMWQDNLFLMMIWGLPLILIGFLETQTNLGEILTQA